MIIFRRLQRMKIGDARSAWKHVTQGIAQGSIVGPFAFNVLINGLLLKGIAIGTSQTSKYVFGVFTYRSYRFHTHMNNRGA